MRGDVAAAAVGTVTVDPVQDAPQRSRGDRGPAFHGLHDVAIEDHQPDERGEIVGAPKAADVGFTRPYGAAEGRIGVGLRVQHLDGGAQVASRLASPERDGFATVHDRDLTLAQSGELAEEQSSAELLQPVARCGAVRVRIRRDDAGFH